MRPTDKAGIFGFPARLTAQDFRSEQPHNRLPCLLARACTCPSYLIVLLHTQMCNFFIGHFEDGHRHGCGSLHLATGGCFQGHWHKGLKHGPGTYISEEGVQMAYCFEHDRLKGGPSRDLLPQVRSTKRERERERERDPLLACDVMSVCALACFSPSLLLSCSRWTTTPTCCGTSPTPTKPSSSSNAFFSATTALSKPSMRGTARWRAAGSWAHHSSCGTEREENRW